MSRAVRIDGKPRNQWALWQARRARADGNAAQELAYEQRADELSYDEQRALQAQKEREFAKQWRAAGGDEAFARQAEARADELDRPTVYPWPAGTSRALAEAVALLIWPDMPVADAPDAALHGILDYTAKNNPQLVYQARAALMDNGQSAEYAARQKKIAEQVDRSVKKAAETAAAAARGDGDRDSPVSMGVGEFASPHAARADGEEAGPFDPPIAGIDQWTAKPKKRRKR